VQVKLGDLGGGTVAGPYGLAVLNPMGEMQLVAGGATSSISGPLTYSANAWGALSGGPSVEITLGPSGSADVTLGAIVTPGSFSAGETAKLGISVNGSTSPDAPELWVSAPSSSALPQTAYGEFQLRGGTPGDTYTLSVLAWVSTATVVASFTNVVISATPV